MGGRAALLAAALLLGVASPGAIRAQTLDYFPRTTFDAYMGNHIYGLSMRSLVQRRAAAAPAPTPPAAGATQYQPSRALAEATARAFLSRLAANEPAASRALGPQLRAHDHGTVWRGIAGPYGLREDDALDALTAYVALLRVVANGASEVPGGGAAVAGLRRQLAPPSSPTPRSATPPREPGSARR